MIGLLRKTGLAFVTLLFLTSGICHFLLTRSFVKIVPPGLPLRREAVYVSGVFELLGAVGLLARPTRRAAGIGLFVLTTLVTPANLYMWRAPSFFPTFRNPCCSAPSRASGAPGDDLVRRDQPASRGNNTLAA